jgi:hypothetical protein
MRSRIIDLALLIGLVVVSGGILWTLFTLGREPRVASTPAQPAPAAAAPATSGANAAANGAATSGAGAGARGVVAIDPDAPDAAPDATAASGAPVGDGAPAADAPIADRAASGGLAAPAASPPRVLPAGTIELERVGYSFVTGGPGACGVVLEAWTHVAVSRDLLETYGCGAAVTVTLDDPVDGRTEVLGVIGDTMNPSFSRTVNVYVGEDEPAFEYGTTAGTFSPR